MHAYMLALACALTHVAIASHLSNCMRMKLTNKLLAAQITIFKKWVAIHVAIATQLLSEYPNSFLYIAESLPTVQMTSIITS